MISDKNFIILTSIDEGRLHLSISHKHRYPSYDEIKEARDRYCDPDKFYVMVLPPKQYYVNLHPYCFHLWEVKSEDEIRIWKGM